MKIGIITWFTGPNYGTNLQAIALQYYLRKQGHEVNIINYEVPPAKVIKENKSLLQKIVNQPKKIAVKYAMHKYKSDIEIRNEKLVLAIRNKCILTSKIKSEEELISVCNSFDLLICGSDQIWNPNWYDRFYFADYDGIKTKRISYAPSMGVNSIPSDVIPNIKRSIEKFDKISVRETKAAYLLEPYLSNKPTVVVDPTLLLSVNEWNEIFKKKNIEADKYILAFFLNDETLHLKATQDFAKNESYKLIFIPYKGTTYLQNADIRADAGLEDLLDLIRSAEYIITDSFHITVFSIIFKKQFFTFQRFKEDSYTSQNVRVTNLLELVNLKERMIPYQSKVIPKMNPINYYNQISKLNHEIEQSKEFLKKAIGKEFK